MCFLRKIYYNLLNLPIKIWVKQKLIPADPIKALHLNTTRPFLYVLPYPSKTDLLILRQQCCSIGLPDPLDPIKIGKIKLPAYIFIDNKQHISQGYSPSPTICKNSIKIFIKYLNLHRNDNDFNIQLLPVLIMLDRSPERERERKAKLPVLINIIYKLFTILWLGRDSFIIFLPAISLSKIAKYGTTDKVIVNKLACLARIHYSRQRLAAVGPKLPIRYQLFNQLLLSKTIKKALEDEAKAKKISLNQAKYHAVMIMEEIAANFSYEAIRLTDMILNWIFNRLYQQINVKHAEHICKLAQNGYDIVYIPSHRSHMDYLLLSYVIYHQGLVTPHIVAGINLDFWPIGSMFRQLGAFFIRRSFKGNKLYSTIFREYLSELFVRGYSIEYFIEGGRSRTGRLLSPKTGLLLMTLQAMLRTDARPIIIIPIYIGYDHVVEVTTYGKELKGAAKEKEGFFKMLKGICKLRKLGQSYINFGKPIILMQYLNKHIPNWRQSFEMIEKQQRPAWLNSIVIRLANQIMISINNAAAANAVNLCSIILLSSNQYALRRDQLIEQIDCYLQLLKNVPYTSYSTIPNKTAEQLLEDALKLNNFEVEKDSIGDIIILSRKNAVIMTYYRNNIIHLLVLPSLVANIVLNHDEIKGNELCCQVAIFYPLLKSELFMRYHIEELPATINVVLDELVRQQLIRLTEENLIIINPNRILHLQLLAASIKEILYRYAIILSLLNTKIAINRRVLEKDSCIIAQRLSILYGVNAPEFFEKSIFTKLVNTLIQEGNLNKVGDIIIQSDVQLLYDSIIKLISPDVQLTIENIKYVVHHAQNSN